LLRDDLLCRREFRVLLLQLWRRAVGGAAPWRLLLLLLVAAGA
jgi:hypothetical protein